MKTMTTGVAVWLASLTFTRDVTVAYVGVPLNVLVACAIGTFCSFAWGEKVDSRKRMWRLGLACVFMGAAITAITNAAVTHFTKMEMTDALQAGMGAVISCLTRFLLPWLVEVIRTGSWVQYIPFLRKKTGE